MLNNIDPFTAKGIVTLAIMHAGISSGDGFIILVCFLIGCSLVGC